MSKQKNLQSQETSYRILKHYLDEVDVIPTFGIRDSFPINQLPQKNLSENANSYQWQFDFLADLWTELGWIDIGISKQIRYSQTGFSIITERGLKIISLNSNVWNSKNLYNFWDILNIDSFGIWKWLIQELVESEKNHQRCWIITHLPPSVQSIPIPVKVFSQIIERFSPRVIAAIFFGQVQKDQFVIQYGGDGTDSKTLANAINHALIAPSISPYTGVNPSWKYYAVDQQSFSILNSFTYYTKLSQTFKNDGAEPNWEFGYSTRDMYDPDSNWPSEQGLNTEFYHHASDLINQVPEMNLLYQRIESRWTNSELNNDSYCKVTSFTSQARKQCMITDDQDDYVEPMMPNDYVASVYADKFGNRVEYVIKDEEETRVDNEEESHNTTEVYCKESETTNTPLETEVKKFGKKIRLKQLSRKVY